jgi:hypothetical protein
MRSTINALLDDGWAIISSTGGSLALHWGNPDSFVATNAAIKWLRSYFDVTKLTCLGQSMGGLASLRALTDIPGITNWYGIYPVTNQVWIRDAGGSLTAGQTAAYSAFGGVTANLPTCDPQTRAAAAYAGKKMRAIASAADTLVSKANNTDLLFTKVGAGIMTVDVHTGDHGDLSAFQPATVVAHLNS